MTAEIAAFVNLSCSHGAGQTIWFDELSDAEKFLADFNEQWDGLAGVKIDEQPIPSLIHYDTAFGKGSIVIGNYTGATLVTAEQDGNVHRANETFQQMRKDAVDSGRLAKPGFTS